MSHSSALLQLLEEQLLQARRQAETVHARNAKGPTIQIPGIGKTISSAYEQLRNAAEYTEEHLLLQRAIRRFYYRSLSFSARKKNGEIGEELIVELTQAGYIPNNTISNSTASAVTSLAEAYVETYRGLRDARISRDQAMGWVLDLLSVETEAILNPHEELAAVAYVAYQHYLNLFPREKLASKPEEAKQYEICLYIAVHLALLKSDRATVRHDLMRMYHQDKNDLQAFVTFNRAVDERYGARLTQKLKRAVSRYGAPMRVLKSMVEDRSDISELLPDREAFLSAYSHQISKEYRSVSKRLTKGIVKSIIFIFITKVIVGLAIEIPYDLLVIGHVAMLPLAINLLFPPLYMASLKLGLKTPSLANAEALRGYIDQAFYGDSQPPASSLHLATKPIPGLAKFVYTLLFFIPFAVTVYVLSLLNFNIVQGVIFFLFLSTASFLGFRLSRMVRELELVTKQSNFLSTVRDFFYLPFIVVGQWISSKYSKVNVVAYMLDIMIELPLKTVLRLIRQWTRFLSERHDEMY